MSLGVGELTMRLQENELEIRVEAAQQLASLGTTAAPAALTLLAASDAEDESLSEWSTAALETCGAPARRDLAQLVEYIQPNSGASSHIIYWALTLIGRMGPEAQSASDQVCQFVECTAKRFADDSENQSLRTSFLRGVWSLGKIEQVNSQAEEVLLSFKDKLPQFEVQIQRAVDSLSS